MEGFILRKINTIMIIIGLTGGIGSGKSTIAKELKKLKIPVFDSDQEVKKLYVKNVLEFFRITMDIYCFGNRVPPKNCGKWNKIGEWGRAEAIQYWSQLCKIKYKDINKYFYSVDD